MQQDDDFNPFPSSTPTRSDLLQSPPIPLVAVALHPENQPNTYSQEEYDKLFRQYDAWKKHAKSLEEGFFAIADMMYETLAFLNAVRLMQGKTPLMITDINAIIESNAVLSQLTNDIRQASIESGYGLVSELVNSQKPPAQRHPRTMGGKNARPALTQRHRPGNAPLSRHRQHPHPGRTL